MTMCTFLFNHDMGKKFRNKNFFYMLKKKSKIVLLDFWQMQQPPTWKRAVTHMDLMQNSWMQQSLAWKHEEAVTNHTWFSLMIFSKQIFW